MEGASTRVGATCATGAGVWSDAMHGIANTTLGQSAHNQGRIADFASFSTAMNLPFTPPGPPPSACAGLYRKSPQSSMGNASSRQSVFRHQRTMMYLLPKRCRGYQLD